MRILITIKLIYTKISVYSSKNFKEINFKKKIKKIKKKLSPLNAKHVIIETSCKVLRNLPQPAKSKRKEQKVTCSYYISFK